MTGRLKYWRDVRLKPKGYTTRGLKDKRSLGLTAKRGKGFLAV